MESQNLSGMAYNRKNLLLKYKQIQEETQRYYVPGLTTYTGVFKEYIAGKWPMSYNTYLKILGTNVNKELKELEHNNGQI